MLAGDYVTPAIRLVRMLGQGGMGSVWIAEHERLRTEVVVKFILGEHATHPESLARFEREATLAAQAKSPHVVQVFDHGVSSGGVPYIAMELLEGEDLGQRIRREGPIAPETFAEWFRQAASGLGRAHKKGIVHRDIKPENIFLCNEDDEVLVKILDFGIAKGDAASTSFAGTRTGAMLGTAYYMSPEQTMGAKSIDARTDLWALGVVTYFALTRMRPFDGEAIGQLVMAITQSTALPPSQHVPTLPPELDVWMQKALARDPGARFASAKEMSAALSEALLGQRPSRDAAPFSLRDSSDAPPEPPSRFGATSSQAVSMTLRPESAEPALPLVRSSPKSKALIAGVGVLAAVALGSVMFKGPEKSTADDRLLPADPPAVKDTSAGPDDAEMDDDPGDSHGTGGTTGAQGDAEIRPQPPTRDVVKNDRTNPNDSVTPKDTVTPRDATRSNPADKAADSPQSPPLAPVPPEVVARPSPPVTHVKPKPRPPEPRKPQNPLDMPIER